MAIERRASSDAMKTKPEAPQMDKFAELKYAFSNARVALENAQATQDNLSRYDKACNKFLDLLQANQK
jgi:hypothetical protein